MVVLWFSYGFPMVPQRGGKRRVAPPVEAGNLADSLPQLRFALTVLKSKPLGAQLAVVGNATSLLLITTIYP